MTGVRILIQLAKPGELPAEVHALLTASGAGEARGSHKELPGLYTAVVPTSADLKPLLERLNALDCIRYAEAESFSQAL